MARPRFTLLLDEDTRAETPTVLAAFANPGNPRCRMLVSSDWWVGEYRRRRFQNDWK